MNRAQLWLTNPDRLLDCEKVIATTKQAGDINSVGTVKIGYTNQLALKPTQNNLEAFGLPQELASNSSIPYTRRACKIVDNGVEVLPNALCFISGVNTKGELLVNVYPDVFNFWDLINRKLISELSFEGSSVNPIDWKITGGASTTHNYRNATTGLVMPVSNYGDFDPAGPAMGIAGGALPSCYYHTVLDHIISNAGYTKSGTIFANTKYLKKVIPFSRPAYRYAAKFLNDRTASAKAAGGQVIVNPVAPVAINFTVLQNDDALGFWDGTNTYTPVDTDPNATSGPPNALFGMRIRATLNITVAGGTVELGVSFPTGGFSGYVGGGLVTGEYNFDTFNNLFTDTLPALNGEGYQVTVVATSGVPTVTINAASGVSFGPFEVPPGPNDWSGGFNQYLYLNALLPDMSQKEFLKDFCVTFNQMIFERNGELIFKGRDEIIADRANAKIWTGKRNTSKDAEIRFQPLAYAQRNLIKYSAGDDLIGADFGQGVMELVNTNIDEEKLLYTSPWSNCQTSPFAAINMAVMSDMPTGSIYPSVGSVNDISFEQEPRPRLLLVRDKYTAEPSVSYIGTGAQASYKVAYFDEPKETDTMRFQQDIDSHWPLLAEALQLAKLAVIEYDLDQVDFAAFDFTVPVFDTDQHYLVNTVPNFVSGLFTSVELLKI